MKAILYIYEDENKREVYDLNEMAEKEKELSKNGCPCCKKEVERDVFLKDGLTAAATFCLPCDKVFTMILY